MPLSKPGRGWVALAAVGLLGAGHPVLNPSSRPPRHVALLIGISDYQNFTPTGPPGQTDLNGPRNDLPLMQSVLRSRLFSDPEDLKVLSDSGASRAGIMAGFHWLLERASDPNDVVVVFYSGHGTNAPDANGDETRVTPGDRKDEALVPWDAAEIHNPAQLIVDDQISAWLDSLPTRNVTVIIDACFSGTVTRGGDETGDTRLRGPLEAADAGADSAQITSDIRGRYTLITASSANQVAQEKPLGPNGEVYGVLTWFLSQAVRGGTPTSRYDDLFRQLLPMVKGRSNQSPQLEGDRGALIFSEKQTVPARPFVQVIAVGGGRYRVDVGAVQGVRSRALYDLFSDGETRFTSGKLGTLDIDSVESLAAYGRLVDTTSAAPPRMRGVLARLPRGARIRDTIPFFENLAVTMHRHFEFPGFTRINDSSNALVAIVPWGQGAMVTVHGMPLLPQESDRANLAPRLRSRDTLVGYNFTQQALCAPLARARTILTLEQLANPAPPEFLQIQAKVLPDSVTPRDGPPGVDTLRIGEPVSLWVKVSAPSRSTLYLSAVVMGYTSTPTVVYPADGEGEDAAGRIQPIELNRWVRLFRGAAPTPPAGMEVIKILVDSDQYSLSSLLESLTCGTTNSQRQRSDPDAPIDGWTTLEHRILIQSP
jgi:hypothetical protein